MQATPFFLTFRAFATIVVHDENNLELPRKLAQTGERAYYRFAWSASNVNGGHFSFNVS